MGWFGALMLALLYAAALLGAGLLVGSWLAGIARMVLERSRLDPEVRQLVVTAVRPTVIVLAVIAALGSIGVDLDGVVALLAVAALTVGLALHGTLANGAAGGLLLTIRPYRPGDLVETAGERGHVVESTLFATTLKTPDGTLITLPNRLVLERPIKNHTRAGIRRIELHLPLDRGADLDALATGLRDAMLADPRLLPDPQPFVRLDHQAQGYLLVGSAWVKTDDEGAVRSDLLRSVRSLG